MIDSLPEKVSAESCGQFRWLESMTCAEQLNNSMMKIGECCENPKIYFPLPLKFMQIIEI